MAAHIYTEDGGFISIERDGRFTTYGEDARKFSLKFLSAARHAGLNSKDALLTLREQQVALGLARDFDAEAKARRAHA